MFDAAASVAVADEDFLILNEKKSYSCCKGLEIINKPWKKETSCVARWIKIVLKYNKKFNTLNS